MFVGICPLKVLTVILVPAVERSRLATVTVSGVVNVIAFPGTLILSNLVTSVIIDTGYSPTPVLYIATLSIAFDKSAPFNFPSSPLLSDTDSFNVTLSFETLIVFPVY